MPGIGADAAAGEENRSRGTEHCELQPFEAAVLFEERDRIVVAPVRNAQEKQEYRSSVDDVSSEEDNVRNGVFFFGTGHGSMEVMRVRQ